MELAYKNAADMRVAFRVSRGRTWSPMVNVTQGHDFSVLFNEATQQLVLQYPSHADFGNSMQVLSEPLGPGDAAPVWNAPTEITTLKACTGFNVGPGTYVPFSLTSWVGRLLSSVLGCL